MLQREEEKDDLGDKKLMLYYLERWSGLQEKLKMDVVESGVVDVTLGERILDLLEMNGDAVSAALDSSV